MRHTNFGKKACAIIKVFGPTRVWLKIVLRVYTIKGYHYRALTQFKYHSSENPLEDKPQVGSLICQSMAAHKLVYFVLVSKFTFHRYAEYKHFKLGSEDDDYRFEIGGYLGNAGDSLNDPWYGSNQRPFSTFDR